MSKCLNKRKLQLENPNEQKSFHLQGLLLQMVSLGGMVEKLSLTILCELQCSFINQVLDLVLQIPTLICIMSWAGRVVGTPLIGIIDRRCCVGVPGMSP